MKKPQFYILDVACGTELTLHGPFTDESAFEAAAQNVRDEQDRETDSIFALKLERGQRSITDAPGSDTAERCSECGDFVEPDDAYFATPCGTYCDTCMTDKHAPGCSVCAKEFDLTT